MSRKKNKDKPLKKPAGSGVEAKPALLNTTVNGKVRNRMIFFLAFLSIALYVNTLGHGYAFDDSVAITENQFTLKGIKGIPDLLTKDFFAGIYGKGLELGGGRYRPLSLVTFAIEQQFWGGDAHVSHFINVLIYGITTILMFIMLLEIFPGALLFSFLVSVLFIVHPVHTEVVANIKSRDELLCFLFLCLTLLWLFRSIRSGKKKYLIYSCVAYFLSLLSKENGITFLLILPLALYCFANRDFKRSLITCIPLFTVAFLYVAVRTYLVGMIGDRTNPDIMENPFVNCSVGEKLATIMNILGKYLQLLFYPGTLSCDYSYNEIPIINWGSIKALFPFLIYIGMSVYAFIQVRKKDIAAFGIVVYLSSLFLVSNIVFNIGAPMGERFLFLPSFGFCLAIVALIMKWMKLDMNARFKFYPALFIPLGIVLVAFSYKTVVRNKDWKDNTTLFGADVNNAPNSAKIHYYYGNNLLKDAMAEKDPQKKQLLLKQGEIHTRRATVINPEFHHAHYNLGMIYQEGAQADSAIASFKRVLALQPTHIMTQGALGGVYGKLKGDFENAIFYLSKAVQYNPADGNSYENLGIAYAMKQDFPASIAAFENAMKLKPNDAQSYMNLGITYKNMGNKEKSDYYFNMAFKLNPALNNQK